MNKYLFKLMSINIIEETLKNIFVYNMFDEDLNNFIKTIKYKKSYYKIVFNIMLKTSEQFIDILPYSYKRSNYLNILIFLTNFLLDLSNNISNIKLLCLTKTEQTKINNMRSIIVKYLCKTNKAQYLLRKLEKEDPYFESYFLKNFENNLITTVNNGTLPLFLFCMKYMKEDSNNYKQLVIDCFLSSNRNSDSRLYEYFLKDNKLLVIIREKIESDSKYLYSILNNLGYSVIDNKYFLKRMRKLDKYLNLKPYINNFHKVFHIDKIINLLPYYVNTSYFNNMDCNMMYDIFEYFNYTDNDVINIEKFYNSVKKFNSQEALQNLKLLINHQWDDDNIYNKTFIKNYLEAFNFPRELLLNKKFRKLFIKQFIKVPIYINEPSILLVLVADRVNSRYNRQINILRKFFGKIFNIQYKTKYYLSRFHMKTTVNDNFTTVPPKHIFTNDITGNIILRPKADGTLVSSINRDVFPNSILSSYIIKAEYVAKLNLYLVFDINLPNTNSLERYRFLRKLHPATSENYEPYKIKNLNDIIKINQQEDTILANFLKESNTKRWYPKATFEGHLSKDEFSILLNNSSDSKKYHNSIYTTDGFIIHSNLKEFKIKPYDMMTIDIKYDTIKRMWLDRERNNMNDYMDDTISSPRRCSIWRCYPKITCNGVKFINKEIREDKRRANPNKIIRQIIEYLEKLQVKYYQKSDRPSLQNLNIIKRQNNRFDIIINKYNINNKSWLDLGCGKGKLLKSLDKMMIYFGIDNDKRLISKNRITFSDNKRVIFKNADILNDCMSKIIPPLKFDYIVMNHSINHFYSDNLIKLLNNLSKPGTILIFNITNKNIMNKRINIEKGFIENKGSETNYKFPWAHNKIVTEKYITETKLKRDLNNFEILEENIFRETEFESIYSWYVMKKHI